MALGNGFEGFGQIAERLDTVELAGFDQRRDAGPGMGALIMTGEQMVLSAKGHHPFILPMSAMIWKFIIAGIPSSVRRSACGGLNSVPVVSFSGCEVHLALSFRFPAGWWIPSPALS